MPVEGLGLRPGPVAGAAGRLAEVIPLLQRTLADSERYLGPDHPLTAAVRDNLEAASRR